MWALCPAISEEEEERSRNERKEGEASLVREYCRHGCGEGLEVESQVPR